MILDNFSQEGSPVVATVIAPGNFIQMILPKHEILLSVMFIYKERNTYVQLIIQNLLMNEKRLPPRLMVLLVVLKGEKVYKVPIRSEIELDHLKDFNTLRRILTPLVQLYHGVGFDTRLTYDEFSIFINDLQHLGYERLDEYSSGIQELVESKPITENNQDVEKIRKGLLISLKSQELSEVLATKIKQAIHEVFENEKKKGGLMNKEPSLEPMESSIIREALYLLTPQLP